MAEIYLDHNASTPCAQEVIDAMLPFFSCEYGNPSSPHRSGKRAYNACNAARESVAELVGCAETEIVFTSGATESNNLVLLGVMVHPGQRAKLVTTAVEHKSIREQCRALRAKGFNVVELPVSNDGVVDINAASDAIDDTTALVTVQGANNEVGALQPIRQIAEIAHSHGALFHCDAAQLIGKMVGTSTLAEFDFVSLSAHKLYGPKGVGALYIRRGIPPTAIAPIYLGGGQEGMLRPGTLNVPGIVGFGIACGIAKTRVAQDEIEIGAFRSRFEQSIIRALPRSRINGSRALRLPGTTSLCIPGVPSSMLISNVPNLCIGDGAACASGAPEPSHVLLAMGLSRDDAESTVRISFGRQNTAEDVDEATCAIATAASQIAFLMDNPVTNDKF